MARPAKIGLDYFPFDVDFFEDIKIRKLTKRQGGKAVAVYACLLCFIYKNGYYIGEDNELPFIVSEKTGFDEVFIQQVINDCFSLGLFDKTLYEQHKIITSKGIQLRYSEVNKRNISHIISEYRLINVTEIGVIVTETVINAATIPISVTKSTQRKVNKSKVNKKEKINKKENPLSGDRESVSENEKTFDMFRQKYQGTKKGLSTEFTNFKKKHKDWQAVLPLLFPALKNQIEWREKARVAGAFIPQWKNLQTWLNQRCWEDELNFNFENKDYYENRKANYSPEEGKRISTI